MNIFRTWVASVFRTPSRKAPICQTSKGTMFKGTMSKGTMSKGAMFKGTMSKGAMSKAWMRLFVVVGLVLFLASGCGSASESQNQLTEITPTDSDAATSSDLSTDSSDPSGFPPEFLDMLKRLGPHAHYFTDYFTETSAFGDEFTVQEISISIEKDICTPLKVLKDNWILVKHHVPNFRSESNPKIDYSLYNLATHETHYLLTSDGDTNYLDADEEGNYLLFEKTDKDKLLFAIDVQPYISRTAAGSEYYRANKIIISHSSVTEGANKRNTISKGNVLFLEEHKEGDLSHVTFMEYSLADKTKRTVEKAIRENFMYVDGSIFFTEFLSEEDKILRSLDAQISYAEPPGYAILPVSSGNRVFFVVEKEYDKDYIGAHVQLYEVFPNREEPALILETSSYLIDLLSGNGFMSWSHNANNIPFVLNISKNKVIRFDGLASLPATNLDISKWSFAFGPNTVLLSITYKDEENESVYKHYVLKQK